MPLDKMQILEYTMKDGVFCPYCRSHNLDGTGDDHIENNEYYSGVVCHACGKHWTDVYKLNDIQEDEPEE